MRRESNKPVRKVIWLKLNTTFAAIMAALAVCPTGAVAKVYSCEIREWVPVNDEGLVRPAPSAPFKRHVSIEGNRQCCRRCVVGCKSLGVSEQLLADLAVVWEEHGVTCSVSRQRTPASWRKSPTGCCLRDVFALSSGHLAIWIPTSGRYFGG
jgi:hypothetical protein